MLKVKVDFDFNWRVALTFLSIVAGVSTAAKNAWCGPLDGLYSIEFEEQDLRKNFGIDRLMILEPRMSGSPLPESVIVSVFSKNFSDGQYRQMALLSDGFITPSTEGTFKISGKSRVTDKFQAVLSALFSVSEETLRGSLTIGGNSLHFTAKRIVSPFVEFPKVGGLSAAVPAVRDTDADRLAWDPYPVARFQGNLEEQVSDSPELEGRYFVNLREFNPASLDQEMASSNENTVLEIHTLDLDSRMRASAKTATVTYKNRSSRGFQTILQEDVLGKKVYTLISYLGEKQDFFRMVQWRFVWCPEREKWLGITHSTEVPVVSMIWLTKIGGV